MRSSFRVTAVILMLYGLIHIVPPAHGSTLRCGSRLISEGDTKFKLLAVCGEPQHIDYWEEERTYRSYTKDKNRFNYSTHQYGGQFLKPNFIKELVLVEEWTYNHGPRRFMDHVRLEKGRIRKIVSGESGY